MSIYYKSEDVPIFKVFEQLAHLAFNCKWDGENLIGRGTEPIKQNHLSLLLAWPGILMMNLVQITGDKFYDRALKELNTNLENGADYVQVKNFLDNIINPKFVPTRLKSELHESSIANDLKNISKLKKELYEYVPDIITKTILLLHPRNLTLVTGSEIFSLIYSLTDFFVLWCMIVRCFDKNDGDAYITKGNIYEIYSKCENISRLDIYSLSHLFPTILDSFINLEIEEYLEFIQNDEKLKLFERSNIITPSIQFVIERIVPANYISYIKKFNSNKIDFGLGEEVIGIGYNIRKILGFTNELWRTISFNHPKSSGYLLFDKEKSQKDFLSTLIEELFRTAIYGAHAIESVSKSWDSFIDNPYEKVDEHLDKYYNWIESILIDDYLTCDEFYKFKNFSRAIGDIDTEIDVEVVKEVRKLYKDGRKNHIPWEHRSKLMDAKRELESFIEKSIEKEFFTEDKYIKYFNETKSQYKYLCLLEEDDIHEIGFSKAWQIQRDNFRKILSIINKKLGGKEYSESKLTKLLGIETSDQKYAKFSF